MRRAALAAIASTLGALLLAVAVLYHAREFRISGTITIASHLHRKVPPGPAVLFIIAENKGGVPIALKRVVNPQFPVSFALKSEDLIAPASRHREALVLRVQMNGHGEAGKPRPGDLEGASKDQVFPGSRGVHIVIEKED